jgi:hypothetical protein
MLTRVKEPAFLSEASIGVRLTMQVSTGRQHGGQRLSSLVIDYIYSESFFLPTAQNQNDDDGSRCPVPFPVSQPHVVVL